MSSKGKKFVCQVCGYESPKWLGRCPHCGSWDSFREVKEQPQPKFREWIVRTPSETGKPLLLNEIPEPRLRRIPTGIGEFDRVLNQGFVLGGVYLLGGDPGIGKSTLTLQAADHIARQGLKVLYVTAEESLFQLKERAKRLEVDMERIFAIAEADLTTILEHAESIEPNLLVIDSIQTIYNPELPSVPGSVAQVRECGSQLLRFAKLSNTTVIAIGHVTKDGTLAGPRTLEHMVDAILYLEGERDTGLRILRAAKNRFGPTDEIGVFEITERGLKEVPNPSELFLSQNRENRIGIAVIPLLEGNRPLLIEAQALVSPTLFAVPTRNTTGFDPRRLAMILAVLEKHAGLTLRNADVFINITGGIRVNEPGADLGIALAIASSFRMRPLPPDAVFVGEIGLGGEVRQVKGLKMRLNEALRIGFKKAFVPASQEVENLQNLEIVAVPTVDEAVSIALPI